MDENEQARFERIRDEITDSFDEELENQFEDERLESGDALVLVSDGVTNYLDERDVASVLRASASAQEAAERLVAEAVQRGGADNATAVVVRRVRSDV